jgi:hypothetical protein
MINNRGFAVFERSATLPPSRWGTLRTPLFGEMGPARIYIYQLLPAASATSTLNPEPREG